MVTGDQHAIAVETCRRLGMGTGIMEGSDLMRGDISLEQLAVKVGDCLCSFICTHSFIVLAATTEASRLCRCVVSEHLAAKVGGCPLGAGRLAEGLVCRVGGVA